MATFITLTYHGGQKMRVNADTISVYTADGNGSCLKTTAPDADGYDPFLCVTETPEQIDALLGVTADPARDAIPDMIDALKMAREYMSDWTGGKPCLDAIDAALAKSGASS